MAQLFRGIALPQAERIGLERGLAAFSLLQEASLDEHWFRIEALAGLPHARDGARVWGRGARPDGHWWVSIDPGEYRITEPPQPCVVHDLKESGIPSWTCRVLLENVLENYGLVKTPDRDELAMIEVCRRRLSASCAASGKLSDELVRGLREAFATSDAEALGRLLEYINIDYVGGFNASVDYLSPVVAIAQLQGRVGVAVQQDWFEEPLGLLAGLIDGLARSEEHRAKAMQAMSKYCNSEYDDARRYVLAAINSSELAGMSRKLILAYHRYFLVFLIEHGFRRSGNPLSDLDFSPVMAEEAIACTLSGIVHGANFVKDAFEHEADRMNRAGPLPLDQLRRLARQLSSEVSPVVTRVFADILAAQALSRSEDPSRIREGVEALRRAAQTTAPDSFERGWINLSLMQAHKALGESDAAESAALEIATQLMLRAVL